MAADLLEFVLPEGDDPVYLLLYGLKHLSFAFPVFTPDVHV